MPLSLTRGTRDTGSSIYNLNFKDQMMNALNAMHMQALKTSASAEGVIDKISQAAKDAWMSTMAAANPMTFAAAPTMAAAVVAGRALSDLVTARMERVRADASAADDVLTPEAARAVAHAAWKDATEEHRRTSFEGGEPVRERSRG